MANSYIVEDFGFERILVEDANRIGLKMPFIHGIGYADITELRKKIKEVRRKRKCTLSLTSYLLYCFSKTIDEQKHIHACKSWRNKLFIFDDIDVFFPIELKNKTLKPLIIRKANRKNLFQIENEIEKSAEIEKLVLNSKEKFFLRLPLFIKDIVYNYIFSRPQHRKNVFGTAYFSTVGIFPNGIGWGIPIPMHSIGMFVGSIENKTILMNDIPCVRDFLSVTLTVDHSINDGAVLARFSMQLKHNINTLIDNEF